MSAQKLRKSWEEIEEKKTSTGVSAEQMYGIFHNMHILCPEVLKCEVHLCAEAL